MPPLISFIIPHKGREHFLIETLNSIYKLESEEYNYEIIVITQNSTLSDEVLSLNGGELLTVFYRPVEETISALRNYGVQQSGSRYLAFLDADIKLSTNWLSNILDCFHEDEDRVLVSAIQKNSTDAPVLEKIRTLLSNIDIDTNLEFLPGRNLFLERKTFDQVGGFPEHLITCEDYYFTQKINQLGNMHYTSKANYIHLGEDKNFGDMFKKEIWRGQSNLKSIKDRKIPIREIPSFIVPIGIMGSLLLSVVTFFINYTFLSIFLILISIIPIIVYSLRLFLIKNHNISLFHILKFYIYYFPARAIGTLGGLIDSIKTTTHNS